MKTNRKQLFYISVALLVLVEVVQITLIFLNNDTHNTQPQDGLLQDNIYTSLHTENTEPLSLSGKVSSVSLATLSSEVSGKIEKVYVKAGDTVKKGDLLLEIENINQRLALKNAEISLNSARLSLQKMQNNNLLSDEDSVLSSVLSQQNVMVESAKNAYLNTDLRAYPEDYDEETLAPTISGNYNCEAEGVYTLEVYSSAASSGASVLISGLENGRTTITTDYSNKLGSCGLEITFPKGFSHNKTWIVPVPNTRSSQYFNAKKNYENTLSGKKLSLKTNSVLPEDISRQKDLVSQASLQYEAAEIGLAKTRVRAPYDGTITHVFYDAGNLANLGSPLFELNSPEWEINADISSVSALDIELGQKAHAVIEGKKYSVFIQSIVNQAENGGQKIPISFLFEKEIPENIFNEMFAEIIISRETIKSNFIESDFLGFGYNGPFINCNNRSVSVNISQENDKGYWIDSLGDTCQEDIFLPSLLQ